MDKNTIVNHFTIGPNEFTYNRPICMYEKNISIPGLEETDSVSISCPGYGFAIYHVVNKNILCLRIPVKPSCILRIKVIINKNMSGGKSYV